MKNVFVLSLLLVTGAGSMCWAADYERKPDRTSVAGLMLEEVDLQTDAKQRQLALEAFVARYPKHPASAWAWDQIRAQALGDSQWERVFSISRQMLETNPEDAKSAMLLLDAGEQSGTPAQVAKALEIAESVSELVIADKTRASKDDAGKLRLATARKIAARAEGIRLKLLVQDADPTRRLALLQGFEKRYPNSTAAGVVPMMKALSLWMLGDEAARPAAQEAAKSLPESEDALFLALASTIAQDPGQESVAAQALWLLEMLQRKPKPACALEAEWNAKRDAYLRTAHVALALAAGVRGDYHLARRSFSVAAAYADGNPDAAASLAKLAESAEAKNAAGLREAASLVTPKSLGFNLQNSVDACLTVPATQQVAEARP
jgi:hypothetical protein